MSSFDKVSTLAPGRISMGSDPCSPLTLMVVSARDGVSSWWGSIAVVQTSEGLAVAQATHLSPPEREGAGLGQG